jgi:methylmalonyl-CoA mutase, C-terminal domain
VTERKTRVLLGKMGLDCHDTAVVTLARILRDAGMEVMYLGLHNSARKLASAAEQEDVDVIGVSFLSGQQLPQTRKLIDELRRLALDDVLLVVGGVIPNDHIRQLEAMGVDAVFTPGGNMSDIVAYIRRHAPAGGASQR